ncbi:hypothetical protein BDV96DRAFT_580257 [Lophiotrema nucula]|uniref:RING-type domain-containing protein n=1 Tax=Lophiotrema nucula TaxID=690887 RepID=A0A6A5Z0Y5_9PLEO|nr:hypothetical protein BDV96DRAFT_580257 [Lophiotrema nucula]
MADGDPKAALLSEELKEYALSLPTSVFPKAGNGNFFCAACGQLAFDAWKLLCCNKSICSSCHDKLEFPTQCPSCEHSPLEADLVTINKSLRNTMRVWLDKRKKKDAKNAAKPATPPAEAVSVTPNAQAPGDTSENAVESVEGVAAQLGDAPGTEGAPAADGDVQANSAGEAAAPVSKETSVVQDDAQRRASIQTENPAQSIEPTPAAEGANDGANNANGSTDGMYGNNAMFGMNGMAGGPGFGFNPNQGNFNNGMGWNGMNSMGGMPNMMGGAGWNNMNPMGGMFDVNNMGMPNNTYGGFGGNMGMPGMNDMSMMGGYGSGFGNNAWQGQMGGGGYGGNFNGYNNPMGGGYNQSGFQNPQNQFPKNNFQNNRFQQRNNRVGSFGNAASGPGFPQNANSRPGSRAGPANNRDGVTPDVNAEATTETKIDVEHAQASGEGSNEGKVNVDGAPDSSTTPSATIEGDKLGDGVQDAEGLTRSAEDNGAGQIHEQGLNQIQTVDSIEDATPVYDQNDMELSMQPDQGYSQGMMNDFSHEVPNMNGQYGHGMGFNHNNYGPRGGYNTAYGAATVLTGEPRGQGVEGAPTGPRAMREGRPNTGFSSRANNSMRFNSHTSVTPAPPVQEVGHSSPPRRSRASPERDEALRTKDRSPTRSRSRSRSRGKEENREDRQEQERPRSLEREEVEAPRECSRTPASDYDRDRRTERRHHRSSRHDDYDDQEERRDDDYNDKHRDDRDDRTSDDSKHRSRRDKDKHRSSRSHRDRSKEHRRRHRSRSPVEEDRYEDEDTYANGADESSSRRKNRSDKDKYRERERDRDREKRHRRDRDYEDDYEYEKEKDRSRDKDRDRKRSRRDREPEEDERDFVEEKYHSSSRRSRKERSDRDKDRDRDYDREKDRDDRSSIQEPARASEPPLNAPTGPAAESDFSIRGFSKSRAKPPTPITTTMPPPTGPRGFQPPTGPRGSNRGGHQRTGSTSIPSTPTTPASAGAQDHYAAEREKNIRERERLDRDRLSSTSHSRASTSTSKPSLSSKRSRDDIEPEEPQAASEDKAIPTGPASHRQKRKKSGEDNIANIFTAGMRKHAGASKRRGGIKVEGDVERELERTERERDGRRW